VFGRRLDPLVESNPQQGSADGPRILRVITVAGKTDCGPRNFRLSMHNHYKNRTIEILIFSPYNGKKTNEKQINKNAQNKKIEK